MREATTGATAVKVERLRRAAGSRSEKLELCAWVAHVNVAEARRPIAAIGASLEAALAGLVDTPYLLAGTRASIREQLLRYRDRLGISYWTIPAEAMEPFAPIAADLLR
jgi:hypothetical protein